MVIFYESLKKRGLQSPKMIISDAHQGEKACHRDRVSGQSVAEMPGTFQEEHSRACTEEIYGGDRE